MGLAYEEFTPDRFWTTQARTVTEADVALFCGLSGDFNPLHSDEEYSRSTNFGGRIAHGPLGMSMAIGLMSQLNLINGTALALLNLNWNFKAPIMLGDTIHARVHPESVRPTHSERGVVALHFEVYKQDGTLVQEGTATLLMKSASFRE